MLDAGQLTVRIADFRKRSEELFQGFRHLGHDAAADLENHRFRFGRENAKWVLKTFGFV